MQLSRADREKTVLRRAKLREAVEDAGVQPWQRLFVSQLHRNHHAQPLKLNAIPRPCVHQLYARTPVPGRCLAVALSEAEQQQEERAAARQPCWSRARNCTVLGAWRDS